MRKFPQLAYLFVVLFFSFLVSCSSDDDGGSDNIDTGNSEVIDNNDSDTSTDNDTPDTDNTEVDNNDTETDSGNTDTETDNGNTDTDAGGTVEGEVNTSSLTERFVFDENIVIENSYDTDCFTIPCRTIDDNLFDVFENGNTPNDNYFSLSEDQTELILECQLGRGRRIEFKQDSEGSLDVPASLEMEGVFEDIPEDGVTIAQVHNRGAQSGNKPFFRVVLYKDGLETVVREDPVVSSGDTRFIKTEGLIPFLNGGEYDLSPLRIIISKSGGFVHINVWQDGVSILDESHAPQPGTDWVEDNGIANGFYLKGGMYNDEGPHTENLVARYTTVIFDSEDTDN